MSLPDQATYLSEATDLLRRQRPANRLNDHGIGLEKARASWSSMVAAGKKAGVKLILLTPTADKTQDQGYKAEDKLRLGEHAGQIHRLAAENGIGLADSFAAFQQYAESGDLSDLLSWANHPNRRGHELVAREILRWFPAA